MKKTQMTIWYNRDPKEIEIDKPEDHVMCLDSFLRSLGFRSARHNGAVVPGRFVFRTYESNELDGVSEIVRRGGAYLTAGNFSETCSV